MPAASKTLRILTLNHHESYLGLLAETGHDFDVIVDYKGLDLSWSSDRVPAPANLRLVSFGPEIRTRLRSGFYDYVLCHTLKNLIWFLPYRRNRFIFIAHIPLFFYTSRLALKAFAKRLGLRAFAGYHSTKVVAVSPFKAETWRWPTAAVIEPSPLRFPLAHQQERYERAVMVGNHLVERGQELGWPLLAPLQERLPIDILGVNPGIAASQQFSSFAAFQAKLRHYRIYLYTIARPYGDGYNLALLEAMSMGMAVVTIANPSTPIVSGVNGLIAESTSELEVHLSYLFEHPREVERLGEAARSTIETRFGKKAFLAHWRELFEEDFCAER